MDSKPKTFLERLTHKRSDTPEIISFQTIRRAVGFLGLLLPAVLVAGTYLFSICRQIEPSISHYYYTSMREVFVGTLCSVSLFLFTYKGYSRLDSLASNAAGFFILLVAIFPTDFLLDNACQQDVRAPIYLPFHKVIHLTSAALFFLTLAAMSYFLFTKSDFPAEQQTPEKKTRNGIYRMCAIVMVLSLVIILFGFIFDTGNSTLTFWFETLALVSFGVSWLTKGEALFGDKPVLKIKKS